MWKHAHIFYSCCLSSKNSSHVFFPHNLSSKTLFSINLSSSFHVLPGLPLFLLLMGLHSVILFYLPASLVSHIINLFLFSLCNLVSLYQSHSAPNFFVIPNVTPSCRSAIPSPISSFCRCVFCFYSSIRASGVIMLLTTVLCNFLSCPVI